MSHSNSPEHILILHVEDNPADAYLTKRVLRDSSLSIDIINTVDGEKTMNYLLDCTAGKHPVPDIVLLDINLPRIDGHELLAWMRSVPALQAIPVFALTSSSSQTDRDKMAGNGAQAYFTKPYTMEECSTIVKSLENFFSGGLPLDQPAS